MQWTEDDSDVPRGVRRLGLTDPADCEMYVMYHGTARCNVESIQAEGFRRSADGMVGSGVYLSRLLEKAQFYPNNCDESDRVVFKLLVNVGKVITISRWNDPRRTNWHDSRYRPVYDTAWVPPRSQMVKSDLEVLCVWDPNRINIINVIYPQPAGGGGMCSLM